MRQIKNKKKTLKILGFVRIIVQIIAFIWIPSLFSQAFSGVKEAAASIGTGGTLLLSDFVLRLLLLCASVILLGRVFCGWLCAFGAVNDWVYRISIWIQKKTGKKLPALPEAWIPVLQKIKYLVLVFVLVVCFFGKGEYISKNSPWTVFSFVTVGNFRIAGYGIAVFLLMLLVVGMIFQERFFCQFFCPMGAVFSLLPEFTFTALRRREKDCIPNCQACRKQCPVHIKLGENSLQSGECIRCGRCMITCPKGNISFGGSKEKEDSV